MLQKIMEIVILVHHLRDIYMQKRSNSKIAVVSDYFRNTFNLLKIRESFNMSLPI